MRHAIVGNGVAGINAALAIRESDRDAEITVVSAETDYYFSRTALMYIAMGVMRLEDTEPFERSFYREKRIALVKGRARRVHTTRKVLEIEGRGAVPYDRLLLATGSVPVMPGWKGSELQGVARFVSYQDLVELDHTLKHVLDRTSGGTRKNGGTGGRTSGAAPRAVVIGGGLIGVEACEVLRSAGFSVVFMIRGGHFFRRNISAREGRYVEGHIRSHGVEVRTNTAVTRIEGEWGWVCAVLTAEEERVPCGIVVIAAGVEPDIALARESAVPCGKGILVDRTMKTGVPGVWAAGDCVEIVNPGEENLLRSVWYSARDMGLAAGENMARENAAGIATAGGVKRYGPGEWYDSAKFFDKEYTAAGDVKGEDPGDFHYQDERHCVRVRVKGGAVKGFSMIGARWDHEVLLRMVRERYTLERFMAEHRFALFEPELFHTPRLM